MLVLVSPDDQLLCPNDGVHLTAKFKYTDQLHTKLLRCGLILEEYLLINPVSKAVIVWKTRHFVDAADFADLPNFRPDEILFHDLNIESQLSWAAGHPHALIKWAATCRDLEYLDFIPWPQYGEASSDTADLVWWAQRINLKVYSKQT